MITNIISPSTKTPALGKMYISKLLSGVKTSSAKVELVVVITVIDKSGCVTFSGEPLVFEIIKSDVVVIKVDLIDIALDVAVDVSADALADVVDDFVVVVDDVVVDVDDSVVESVVFSGSVLIGLIATRVGGIGVGCVVVVVVEVVGPTNTECELVMEHSKLQMPQQTSIRGVQ